MYTLGTVWFTCALTVQLRYVRGAVEVHSWYGHGTLVVQSGYTRGAVEVHSWCAFGTVQFLNFLSGGTINVWFV